MPESLERELFTLGNFSVLLWHVLAVAAVILVIVMLCIIVAVARKNKAQKEVKYVSLPATAQTGDEVQATNQAVADEAKPANETAVEDGVEVEVVSEEEPDEAEEPEENQPEEEPTTQSADKKPRVKNYHVSLRTDGKWQVKLSKGAKPLKLFDTQAQAIAFAKEKAKNQEGHITIHKVDGKIRKQKY